MNAHRYPGARLAHVVLDAVALVSLVAACGSTHGAEDGGPFLDAATQTDAPAPVDAPAIAADAAALLDDAAGDGGRPHVDLLIELRDFDAFEGVVATVRATDTSIGEVHGPIGGTLVGGDADLVIPRGFARDLFGEIGHLWLDVSADGVCTDGSDQAYSFFINNDFEMGPETVRLTPTETTLESATCAEATD